MNPRFRKQANKLYRALKRREQTWTRRRETLHEWACEFRELAVRIDDKKIRRVLDWFCEYGCGALFVPLIGTGEAFCDKFHDIDKCRKRLRNQALRYFDDILDYKLSPGHGSRVQREHQQVVEKMGQRIAFVDDLKHGRVELPTVKAKLRSRKKTKPLTRKERQTLSRLLIVDRDTLFRLMMEQPGAAAEYDQYLEERGIWKKLREFGKRRGL